MPKYLFIQRSMPRTTQQKPQQPSRRRCRKCTRIQPWKEKFKDNIVTGGKLQAGARSCRSPARLTGPLSSRKRWWEYSLFRPRVSNRRLGLRRNLPGVIHPDRVSDSEYRDAGFLSSDPVPGKLCPPSAAPGLVEHSSARIRAAGRPCLRAGGRPAYRRCGGRGAKRAGWPPSPLGQFKASE